MSSCQWEMGTGYPVKQQQIFDAITYIDYALKTYLNDKERLEDDHREKKNLAACLVAKGLTGLLLDVDERNGRILTPGSSSKNHIPLKEEILQRQAFIQLIEKLTLKLEDSADFRQIDIPQEFFDIKVETESKYFNFCWSIRNIYFALSIDFPMPSPNVYLEQIISA
ncbi:MAG: hypothetical protein MHMPM18_001773 [Marteilia pararefringens]